MSIYEGSIKELPRIDSLWSEFLVANLSTDELFIEVSRVVSLWSEFLVANFSTDELFIEELSRVKSLCNFFLLSNFSKDKFSISGPFGKVFPWVVTFAAGDFGPEFGGNEDWSTLLAVVLV